MCSPEKPLSPLYLSLLVLAVAGWVLWLVSDFGFIEPFVVDDLSLAVENADFAGSQDTPILYGSYTAVKEIRNTLFAALVHLPFFLVLGFLLTGAIFRLKLVRLTPRIGPPRTFFA